MKGLARRSAGFLILVMAALCGCTTSEVLVAHSIDLVQGGTNLPEEQLLDVGIRVFDPGVPDGEVDEEVLKELLDDRVFVHIRRTESVYMAVQLRETMQQSGHWGAIWVTPRESAASDLNVNAKILRSDGDIVRVDIMAVDASGRTWIDQPYELEIPAGAYDREYYPDLDPYQDLFNWIANDLAVAASELSEAEAREIRTVGAIRYASELSPAAFDGYIAVNRSGIHVPVRLPAAGDPMFDQTQRVRQRESLFFETLNLYYEDFSSQAALSYDKWREAAREESTAIREMRRSARWRTGIGIAALLASILYDGGSSFADRVVHEGMMSVGVGMLEMNTVNVEATRLHEANLEELSSSFDDQVEPLVAEIGGTQHRLTGTAEAQYEEWRNLLRQLFLDEVGFGPENLKLYAEPKAEARSEGSKGRSSKVVD